MLARIILVDDGTPRDISRGKQKISASIEESAWISYPENKGKGFALRKGMEIAGGDLLLYTDHDFPYTYGSMLDMISIVASNNADIAIGVRDESYYAHISRWRAWLSRKMQYFNRRFLKLPTDDSQCGLKVFSRKLKDIFMQTRTNRYLIDVEFLKLISESEARTAIYTVRLRDNVKLSRIKNLKLVRELMSYMKIVVGDM